VRPLGVLAMIDEGELDWKLIVINVDDPLAASLNDIADVEAQCEGVVSGIREWFRWYKTPDDKPINAFGFDEKALDAAAAVEVIEETHAQWQALIAGTTEQGKMWIK
jgi:inorganic pyrophosphatase